MRTLFAVLTIVTIVFGCLFNFWWLPWQEQKDAVHLIKSRLGMGEGEMGDYKYESMEEFPWWKREFASRLGRDSVARVTTAYSEGTGYPIDISAWKGLKGVETVSFDRALVEIENFQGVSGRKYSRPWKGPRSSWRVPETRACITAELLSHER